MHACRSTLEDPTFAERAAAVSSGFTIHAGNAGAVSDICRHLDGIPLAIELAAARTRAMPPSEICARLGDRFRLLTAGSRRSLERHRTLLGAVAWSHDLLDGDERAVFRRLAVFPASFGLAAAEAVARHDDVDVLDCVVRLVDRSLVQYHPDTGRYRLLETLRQYAADRLGEAGETDDARERHARHFLAMVDDLAPALTDARYPVAHAALVADLDNVRAAAEWSAERGHWGDLMGLARKSWYFLYISGVVEAESWYLDAIEHSHELDPQVVIDALGELAFLLVINRGDYPTTVALTTRSMALAADAGREESAMAWLAEAMVDSFQARGPKGLAAAERALAVGTARGDVYAEAIAPGVLATWLTDLGAREANALAGVARAERTGHPFLVRAAVVCASATYQWRVPNDFAGAHAVLAPHKEDVRLESILDMWLDVEWGANFVGRHAPGAVARLSRAAHLGDRLHAPHAVDLAVRLLAIAAAGAGFVDEAAQLSGYADGHLRPYRIDTPDHEWVGRSIEERLEGHADRVRHEAAGAGFTRRQAMALVSRLEAAIVDGVDAQR